MSAAWMGTCTRWISRAQGAKRPLGFEYSAWLALLGLLGTLLFPAFAQQPPSNGTSENIDSLALKVAGDRGSSLERTQKLVSWINTNFNWTDTDYEQRTAEQIIQRRGGNCAELSRVLVRLLKPTDIRYRWIEEINIEPYNPRRQKDAAKRVAEKGNTASVFGLRHNDHRWLEIFDDHGNQWVPADPAVGVIGMNGWVRLRMGLQDRPKPAVPAVADVVKDMIVPFAVIAITGDRQNPQEDRSDFYLIDGFNHVYAGKLSALPSWGAWVRGIHELSPLAAKAFEGKINLHESNDKIAALADLYEKLRVEASRAGLVAASEN